MKKNEDELTIKLQVTTAILILWLVALIIAAFTASDAVIGAFATIFVAILIIECVLLFKYFGKNKKTEKQDKTPKARKIKTHRQSAPYEPYTDEEMDTYDLLDGD